jgi:hypothetical protein
VYASVSNSCSFIYACMYVCSVSVRKNVYTNDRLGFIFVYIYIYVIDLSEGAFVFRVNSFASSNHTNS